MPESLLAKLSRQLCNLTLNIREKISLTVV